MSLGARIARDFSLAACCIFCAGSAFAHGEDQSSLSLRVGGSSVSVEWRIAVKDLEHAIGLDTNGDGEITWGELRSRHGAIADYALARLRIRSRSDDCPAGAVGHWVDKHHDGAYAVLRFTAKCPGNIEAMDISYSLLFDLDRQHMGILRLQHRGRAAITVFDVGRSARRCDLTGRQITFESLK